MNFYEFFNQGDLLSLTKSIFGNCDVHWLGGIGCDFSNRDILFRYHPDKNSVEISFYFIDDPEEKSQGPYVTGRRLQSGTMAGVRKLQQFATELKKRGIGISYSTQGKRGDIYKRVLQKAGMSGTTDMGNWAWR